MSLKGILEKIGDMITDYNKDLAYDEDDRIATVQVILTRPEERVGKDKPSSIYVTPRNFTAKMTDPPKYVAPSYTLGETTVTYSTSNSSTIQCCAPGWIGLVDPFGQFYACFPVPGACPNYPMPYPCAV